MTSVDRARALLLTCVLSSSIPALAVAQDFGVMESAETINKGNFKVRANPMVLFGKDQDSEFGVALVAGYGFTSWFDVEGGVAIYDGRTFFGGNAEFWLLRREPFDFSVSAGLHGERGSNSRETTGMDVTFLPSKRITNKLDIYGALDLAFESISDKLGGGSFQTAHLVPGVEYRAHPDLDIIVEFGIGLNADARHYVSGGFAYYFR